MTRIVSGMAVSIDGYIAGPDDGPEQPLGTRWRSTLRVVLQRRHPEPSLPVVPALEAKRRVLRRVRQPVRSSDKRQTHLRHR